MSTRRRLENRRPHISFRFSHDDTWYTCGLGYFLNDKGEAEIGEIFLNADKVDSDLDVNAGDAAIAVSLALQYSAPIKALLHTMKREPNGNMSSAIGRALQLALKNA